MFNSWSIAQLSWRGNIRHLMSRSGIICYMAEVFRAAILKDRHLLRSHGDSWPYLQSVLQFWLQEMGDD